MIASYRKRAISTTLKESAHRAQCIDVLTIWLRVRAHLKSLPCAFHRTYALTTAFSGLLHSSTFRLLLSLLYVAVNRKWWKLPCRVSTHRHHYHCLSGHSRHRHQRNEKKNTNHWRTQNENQHGNQTIPQKRKQHHRTPSNRPHTAAHANFRLKAFALQAFLLFSKFIRVWLLCYSIIISLLL